MKIFITIIIFALISCAQNSRNSEKVTIRGTLVGNDGNPIELANVVVKTHPNDKEELVNEKISSDGKFSFKLQSNEVYFIEYSGVNHISYGTDLITNESIPEVEVFIKLSSIASKARRPELVLIDKSSDEINTQTLKLQEDNTYSVTFDNKYDTLKYQIYGHLNGQKATNGTQQNTFEYDGYGDYNSLIIGKKGKITITFDPAAFPEKQKQEYKIITQAHNEFDHTLKEIDQYKIDLYEFQNRPRSDRMQMMKTRADYLRQLDSLHSIEKDDFVKTYIGLTYLEIVGFNPLPEPEGMINRNLIRSTLDNLPVESSFWAFGNMKYFLPTMFHYAQYDKFTNEKILSLYENNKGIREFILVSWMQEYQGLGNQEKVKELYAVYDSEYKSSQFYEQIKDMFDPNKNIVLGNPAPDFNLVNLDDNSKINLAKYNGKYLLIDFWATWCAPCMREMDNLHMTYNRFKDKNFDILSLSFDQQIEAINTHRTNSKYKMPWDHAYLEGNFNNPLSKTYEVKGIPKPILIDPDGKIIALEAQLRGPALIKTIESYLGS